MNTYFSVLFLILISSCPMVAATAMQPGQKDRPTKLARYQVGTYLAAEGTKLRINIEKQLGGQLTVQLSDLKGNLYFDRPVRAWETTIRLSMDLTELPDGDYLLKVSNGLEITVRDIKITTSTPVITTRSITLL